MDCQTARTELHIEPATVQAHVHSCAACAAYARRYARLDTVLRPALLIEAPAIVTQTVETIVREEAPRRLDLVLRDELVIPTPSALTSRLLDLVPQPARVASPLDVALRDELMMRAPVDLTARLTALVPQVAAPPVVVEPAPIARPRRWIVMTVYAVTAVLLALSLMFAGQIYTAVFTQLGIDAWLSQIAGLPADFLEWLYAVAPQSRVVVGAIVRLQQPLQWLLVALIMWAVLDMAQRSSRTEQQYARS